MRARPELSEALKKSIRLRVPTFPLGTPNVAKISALEDHMLESAHVQGDLTEERLDWLCGLVPIQDEWDHIPEDEWRELRRTRTELAVKHAKRQVRPELYDQIMDHEWMIKRLTEEIDRLEQHATVCSRAYTMLTGS